jgi:hypothetical protein
MFPHVFWQEDRGKRHRLHDSFASVVLLGLLHYSNENNRIITMTINMKGLLVVFLPILLLGGCSVIDAKQFPKPEISVRVQCKPITMMRNVNAMECEHFGWLCFAVLLVVGVK